MAFLREGSGIYYHSGGLAKTDFPQVNPVLVTAALLHFSQAVDSGLLPVKQEPLDPEEENKNDYVSESAPEEEAGGPGTPVVSAGGCPPCPDLA
jgi:hypothetical protein